MKKKTEHNKSELETSLFVNTEAREFTSLDVIMILLSYFFVVVVVHVQLNHSC